MADELPAYGAYVERERERLGADHPFIRTEYELVELNSDGGLFPPSRRGQMRGDHQPLERGLPGETYALLLDVAGEEEDQLEGVVRYDATSRRDSTALTVVRVVRGALTPGAAAPPPLPILGEGRGSDGERSRAMRWCGAICGPGRSTRRCISNCSIWRGMFGGRALSWSTPPVSAPDSRRFCAPRWASAWCCRSSSRCRARASWAGTSWE